MPVGYRLGPCELTKLLDSFGSPDGAHQGESQKLNWSEKLSTLRKQLLTQVGRVLGDDPELANKFNEKFPWIASSASDMSTDVESEAGIDDISGLDQMMQNLTDSDLYKHFPFELIFDDKAGADPDLPPDDLVEGYQFLSLIGGRDVFKKFPILKSNKYNTIVAAFATAVLSLSHTSPDQFIFPVEVCAGLFQNSKIADEVLNDPDYGHLVQSMRFVLKPIIHCGLGVAYEAGKNTLQAPDESVNPFWAQLDKLLITEDESPSKVFESMMQEIARRQNARSYMGKVKEMQQEPDKDIILGRRGVEALWLLMGVTDVDPLEYLSVSGGKPDWPGQTIEGSRRLENVLMLREEIIRRVGMVLGVSDLNSRFALKQTADPFADSSPSDRPYGIKDCRGLTPLYCVFDDLPDILKSGNWVRELDESIIYNFRIYMESRKDKDGNKPLVGFKSQLIHMLYAALNFIPLEPPSSRDRIDQVSSFRKEELRSDDAEGVVPIMDFVTQTLMPSFLGMMGLAYQVGMGASGSESINPFFKKLIDEFGINISDYGTPASAFRDLIVARGTT